jgi:hypothetical protein
MKRLVMAASRCSLILLVPAIAYAVTAQWTGNGNKAKNGTNARPAQHSGTHKKPTAGRNEHASHGTHGAHGTHSTGTSTHGQPMGAHHHSSILGRNSRADKGAARSGSNGAATPTPTPTPEPLPESASTLTPTPSPTGDSAATP